MTSGFSDYMARLTGTTPRSVSRQNAYIKSRHQPKYAMAFRFRADSQWRCLDVDIPAFHLPVDSRRFRHDAMVAMVA
jgi:hypothetical protein